mgnify:CR=1 FL=1
MLGHAPGGKFHKFPRFRGEVLAPVGARLTVPRIEGLGVAVSTLRLASLPKALSDLLLRLDRIRLLRVALVVVALALAGVAAVWVAGTIMARGNWPAYTDMGLYLDAADELANGRNPYVGADLGLHRYPYPPLFAEIIAVLVAIFGPYASFVWIISGGAFLVASMWIMCRRFGFSVPMHWVLLASGVLLVGRTARVDLMHGQLNFMLLLLLVTGLLSWRAQRTWTASVLWAIAICCKPFLGVVVFFLFRAGSPKTAVTTLGLSALIFGLSFLPTFPDVFETFQSWRDTTQHYASPLYAANPLNQSFYALGLRLFTDNDFSQPWLVSPFLAAAVPVLALILAALVFWVAARPRTASADEEGMLTLTRFGAALGAVMSLGPVTEGDHLYFVLPGAIGAFALTWRRVREDSPAARPWLIASAAWLVLVTVLAWPRELLLYFGDPETWVHLRGAGILLSGANGILLLTAASLTALALRK